MCFATSLFFSTPIIRVDSNEVFKHAYLGLKTASGCVVGPGHGTPGCACRGSHTSSGSLQGG